MVVSAPLCLGPQLCIPSSCFRDRAPFSVGEVYNDDFGNIPRLGVAVVERKFRQRFDRWSNEKGGITGDFAFRYLAKHEIVLESEMIQTFCPKKYARCRRGACEFTAQT